jgi:hypothetical protein
VVLRFRGIAWGCVLALFSACGTLSEPERSAPVAQPDAGAGAAPGHKPASFACDPDSTAKANSLRRLTMTQYRNTVRDLMHWALPEAGAAEAVIAGARLDELPEDRREPVPEDVHGSYRRLDQSLEQQHVDGFYRVGKALATALADPGRLGRVAGTCAVDADPANDESCLTDFIQRFGARVLRGPPDAEELAFYRSVYGADPTALPAGYADVMSVMLSSPRFLYFVEQGDQPVDGKPGVYTLSSYELASRLSYHFWQTLPDAELWELARDGSLLEPSIYERQVDRLAADARARSTMGEFFSDWLKLEDLPPLDAKSGDPRFAAFAGADLPGPELRQRMIDEVLELLAHYTWTEPGGTKELFTSELSFARSRELSALYGVEPWDGLTPPPRLPAGQRPGLLTRALFLTTGSANTRPIMKGVFLRRQMLCDSIPPPPAGVNAMPPELRPGMTTRQVVEELTERPDTQCAGCHAARINPLGFAFEGFDALGRSRTEQRLFDPQGAPLGELPVDTRGVPRVTPDDPRESTGPADLMKLMLESGKLDACLARNYFRFTYGRWDDPLRDGCVLERLRTRLVETGRIAEMLKEAALVPEFKQRSFD